MSELKEKELKAGNNGRGVSALKRLLCCPNCGKKPLTEKDEVDVFLTFCSNFPAQNCDYIAPGFSKKDSKKEWNRYARKYK